MLNYFKRKPIIELILFAYSRIKFIIDFKFSTIQFYARAKVHGINVGKNIQVCGPIYFYRYFGSKIQFGDDIVTISRPDVYALNIFPHSKIRTMSSSAIIKIDNNVSFNSICIVARSKTISIGENTLIGGNCQIMDTDFHPLWPPSIRKIYSDDLYDKPVLIGKNVFIGLNVIILKGSKIGDNSVIAAGSVVSGEIPSNCIAGGIPCKVIKYFS